MLTDKYKHKYSDQAFRWKLIWLLRKRKHLTPSGAVVSIPEHAPSELGFKNVIGNILSYIYSKIKTKCFLFLKNFRKEEPHSYLFSISNYCRKEEPLHETIVRIKLQPVLHSERVRDAVEQLDIQLDNQLMKQRLIGKVAAVSNDALGKSHIRRKCVTFSWQRGIKIGQGRFGKVYTAVNNNTGEMMAVKEVAVQYNDTNAIKRVAEELKILEGISHRNLVKYYGIEIHRVSKTEQNLLFENSLIVYLRFY